MMSNKVLSLFVFCGFINSTISATSGPYTTTLRGFKQCEKQSSRYLQEPIGTAYIEPYNAKKKNVVKGNITVIGDTNHVKANIQEFYFEDGKWMLTLTMKNLSCRSHFISDLIMNIDMMYDKKTCNVPKYHSVTENKAGWQMKRLGNDTFGKYFAETKGTYSFELDYNAADHLWARSREYGRMLRRVEASTKLGTVLCLQFESDVVADTQ